MAVKKYLEGFKRKAYIKSEPKNAHKDILNCALGVNPWGCSEKVLKAVRQYNWKDISQYPDPCFKELKEAIIRYWEPSIDLSPSQIQIGSGSFDVLERINRMFLEPGVRVLGVAPQFTGYISDIAACGAVYDPLPLDPAEGFTIRVESLLRSLRKEYAIVYLDNPNNPTGNLMELDELESVVKAARKIDVVVLVDEAYGDYVSRSRSAVGLLKRYDNLIVTRTVAKGLGLASIRIGYGILPPSLTEHYNKIISPARAAGFSIYLAEKAIRDQDFIKKCRIRVVEIKREMIEGLKSKGYLISNSEESCPIFLLGHLDSEVDLYQEFLSKGILTVPGEEYDHLGRNFVRIRCPIDSTVFLERL